jgi:Na+/H+-dicarboxylate symporter
MIALLVGPVARIIIRILAGIMIGYALPHDWVDEVTRDPDVVSIVEAVVTLFLSQIEMIVGIILLALNEAFYAIAKKYGWKT